jgi:nicotinamide-nucleotide amidase
MTPDIEKLVGEVVDAARSRGVRIVTAESCTGGLVAAALTSVAGSSDVFEAGLVTYSNEAKADLLGASADLIARRGAVSAQAARAMAEGAIERTRAALAVAVTGIAGPGGGSVEKPIGLVYFATALAGGETLLHREVFAGRDRAGVREAATCTALELLMDRLE